MFVVFGHFVISIPISLSLRLYSAATSPFAVTMERLGATSFAGRTEKNGCRVAFGTIGDQAVGLTERGSIGFAVEDGLPTILFIAATRPTVGVEPTFSTSYLWPVMGTSTSGTGSTKAAAKEVRMVQFRVVRALQEEGEPTETPKQEESEVVL